MKKLRMLCTIKGPKTVTYLVVALALGVLMMAMTGSFFRGPGESALAMPYLTRAPEPPPVPPEIEAEIETYEQALEARLEGALALVDGVGRVRVLVSMERGRETVFAVDRNTQVSVTQEEDAQGGTRHQSSQSSQDNTLILSDRTGVDRPLVVQQIEPVIGGVIIIAEGGGNILVRDALIRATSGLLGISVNRVHVMQMRDPSPDIR